MGLRSAVYNLAIAGSAPLLWQRLYPTRDDADKFVEDTVEPRPVPHYPGHGPNPATAPTPGLSSGSSTWCNCCAALNPSEPIKARLPLQQRPVHHAIQDDHSRRLISEPSPEGNGNPLIVGGGGLVTAGLMLAIVAVWYGIVKRPARPTNLGELLRPKRKRDRLDWLR